MSVATIDPVTKIGGSDHASINCFWKRVCGPAHSRNCALGFLSNSYGAGGATFTDKCSDAKSMNPGIDRQTKAAFLYGGELEYGLTRNFGVRAEYRGFIYKAADFNSP